MLESEALGQALKISTRPRPQLYGYFLNRFFSPCVRQKQHGMLSTLTYVLFFLSARFCVFVISQTQAQNSMKYRSLWEYPCVCVCVDVVLVLISLFLHQASLSYPPTPPDHTFWWSSLRFASWPAELHSTQSAVCIKGFAAHLSGPLCCSVVPPVTQQTVGSWLHISGKTSFALVLCKGSARREKHCWWSFGAPRNVCALLTCWKRLSDPERERNLGSECKVKSKVTVTSGWIRTILQTLQQHHLRDSFFFPFLGSFLNFCTGFGDSVPNCSSV